MTENNIKLVNEGGKIVGKDPETGETVPIELGETITESISTEQVSITGGEPNDFHSVVNANEGLTVEGQSSDRHWELVDTISYEQNTVTVDIDGLLTNRGDYAMLDFQRLAIDEGDGEIHATLDVLNDGDYSYKISGEDRVDSADHWVLEANGEWVSFGAGDIRLVYQNSHIGLIGNITPARGQFDPIEWGSGRDIDDSPSELTLTHSDGGNVRGSARILTKSTQT